MATQRIETIYTRFQESLFLFYKLLRYQVKQTAVSGQRFKCFIKGLEIFMFLVLPVCAY